MPAEPSKRMVRSAVLATAIVAVITMMIFLPAIAFDFTRVDDGFYVRNPHVLSGLSPRNVLWAFKTTEGYYWTPLVWLSFMGESTFLGCTPSVTHATNVMLHSVNGALLCLLLISCGAEAVVAALVALLFCLHPMRLEAVAWVPGRKDLLFVLFALLACISYFSADDSGAVRARRALPFFILSLMAKPAAIVLPFLLLTLDYWPLHRFKRGSAWKLIMEKWPLFALMLGATALVVLTEHGNPAFSGHVGFFTKLKVSFFVLGIYLKKTILPPWRDFPWGAFGADPDFPVSVAVAISCSAVVAALTAVAYSRRRSWPWLAAGWAWFVVSLLPVLGFSRFSPAIACERYTYLAHIGFAFALAGTLGNLRNGARGLKRSVIVMSVFGLIALSAVTLSNLPMWSDTGTLLGRMTEVYPRSAWARMMYGIDLLRHGSASDASVQLAAAIELHPEKFEAWNDQGVAMAKMGKFDEALRDFDQALARQDDPEVAQNRRLVANGPKGGLQLTILTMRPWPGTP